MPLKLIKTVDAATAVVSDVEQKLFTKIDETADDALVTQLNATATDYVADRLERAFVTETWELSLDAWPMDGCPIELCRVPAIAITSITYIDTDGASQTLASTQYTLDDKAEPPAIYRAYEITWPTVREVVNAITVTFTVGYGTAASSTPEKFKEIIKFYFSHLYEHREPTAEKQWRDVPHTLEDLLTKYELKVIG
jgi:uncharacterized phiE125 gp8 family phage protein